MNERLPASVEATGLIRRVEASGDFAAVIRSGDPDRGAILLLVQSRGRHQACLERMLASDGSYRWQQVGPTAEASSADVESFVARRTRIDPDSWQIELDIADAERFIAETIAAG